MNKVKVDRLTQKLKARKLYVTDRETAKYISQTLGVSENTISNWVRVNGWKNAKTRQIQAEITGVNIQDGAQILKDFKTHLRKVNRRLHDKVAIEITNFLTLLN